MGPKKRIVATYIVLILLSLALMNTSEPLPVSPEGWGLEIHIEKVHRDKFGNILSINHHPGNLTDYGANWLADVLGDADGDQGDYIGLTNSTDAYADGWTSLPDEITTEGMTRAIGAYVDDGVGAWNITKTFAISGTNSTQRAGLYHNVAGNTLVASDTFALTNVENGDTLTITFQISVSD